MEEQANVVIVAPSVRAGTHRDDPLCRRKVEGQLSGPVGGRRVDLVLTRLGHLIVHASERGRHLVCQRTSDLGNKRMRQARVSSQAKRSPHGSQASGRCAYTESRSTVTRSACAMDTSERDRSKRTHIMTSACLGEARNTIPRRSWSYRAAAMCLK